MRMIMALGSQAYLHTGTCTEWCETDCVTLLRKQSDVLLVRES